MNKKTLKDINVSDKKVIVRVDFNVPLEDGKVTDDNRIKAALPTIKYLINEDAYVILMSHLGRPKGEVDESLRLDPVADRLADLLGQEVKKVDNCIGEEPKKAIKQMDKGDVLLLENTRFHKGEKENDPEFSKQLSEIADIFVLDAFGAAHRAHASTVGVGEYLPSAAGFLLQREVQALSEVMENPEHPFVAVMGGAKVSDKMEVIRNLYDKVDYLITGGGIANTFIRAQGHETGESLVEEDKIDLAKDLMAEAEQKGVELVFPVDVYIADEFSENANCKMVNIDEIPADWQVLDCGGEKSLKKYKEIIDKAKTVIWNGPLGVFEFEKFEIGTKTMAEFLANCEGKTVVGGGESAAATIKYGVADKMDHVSTGGGASLQFFEGKPLPAVEALDALN